MRSSIYQEADGSYWVEKDPDSKLKYFFDWSAWLIDSTDSILTAEYVTAGDVTAEPSTISAGVASVLVSGGVVGQDASVACRITTASGMIDDRSLNFKIVEG